MISLSRYISSQAFGVIIKSNKVVFKNSYRIRVYKSYKYRKLQ